MYTQHFDSTWEPAPLHLDYLIYADIQNANFISKIYNLRY